MFLRGIFIAPVLMALTASNLAAQDSLPQGQPVEATAEFCSDPANAELQQCADLLETGATNLGTLVGGGFGAAAVAGLAGGGATGSTSGTVATTSTN